MFTSLFISLSVSGFSCCPLFCSQEIIWCDEGLTGPVVFYSLLHSPALAPDLSAELLINRVGSCCGDGYTQVTFSIVKSIQVK